MVFWLEKSALVMLLASMTIIAWLPLWIALSLETEMIWTIAPLIMWVFCVRIVLWAWKVISVEQCPQMLPYPYTIWSKWTL